jgi:hypothetical protein
VNKELNTPATTEPNGTAAKSEVAEPESTVSPSFASKHHSMLMQAVAEELEVKPEDIFDFEL